MTCSGSLFQACLFFERASDPPSSCRDRRFFDDGLCGTVLRNAAGFHSFRFWKRPQGVSGGFAVCFSGMNSMKSTSARLFEPEYWLLAPTEMMKYSAGIFP